MPEQEPVFILISCDPRSTGRAFEAMRIAVGIVAGENDITLVLTGPAVHLLDDDTDDLVDGDDIDKFRTNLKRLDIPFHVDATSVPADTGWNAAGHPVIVVTAQDIAGFVRRARRALIF